MKLAEHRLRLIVLVFFFFLFSMVLLYRLLSLTVLESDFLKNQGNARSLRVLTIPSFRGMIIDRQGEPLAISTPVQSIWIHPQQFHASKAKKQQITSLLSLEPQFLDKKLAIYKNKEFFYLKRQISPLWAKKLLSLKIPGLYAQQEFKRFYPEAESMAQILGFTNVDDQGIEGLEMAYQKWLEGIDGKKRVIKDRMGRVIQDLEMLRQPRPGRSIQLSLDRRIQFFAYNELIQTIHHFEAKSGTVVVLDAKTGEVLAMVNAPSFNPNIREHYALETYRNRALTDAFEPGSVMKPFAIASALESGHFKPDSIIDTRPSQMYVQGHIIRDVHDYGVLDVTGVLRYSSNVGVSKMVLTSPPDRLLNILKNSGIGQPSETGYPGENIGSLIDVRQASPFMLATVSFGYGMSANALQIARAYSVFANHGKVLPVTLLKTKKAPNGDTVMKPETADTVLNMLEAVVLNGTGRSAMVPGYRVAGKTGTALISEGSKGYAEKRYVASFIGMAPVSNPRFIVAVFIHDPNIHKGYYGAQVAGPLFSKVMDMSLHLLNVPPDTLKIAESQ
ncbi:MAG: penicillin-binding protein 2 [Gammaproteobacteria bacterium]|nr:penicillin-binding protein 2 [Gammaproteobacteria bacterium]